MSIKFKKVNALPTAPTTSDDGIYFVKSGDKYVLTTISKGVVFKMDAVSLAELTTQLSGYVSLTGNQTIAGVKTFSASPVVPNATTNAQAINKGQLDTAINSINTQLASGLRVPKGLDCSTNPNTPAGAKKGDTWLVTKAGKFGGASGIIVQIGDMIICTADTPTSGTATTNFFVVESNQQPASETVAGYIRISTSAEATAGTDNTTALSPVKGKALAEARIKALSVLLTGDQIIQGVKAFKSSPFVPNATKDQEAVNKGQLDAAIKSASLEWSSEDW